MAQFEALAKFSVPKLTEGQAAEFLQWVKRHKHLNEKTSVSKDGYSVCDVRIKCRGPDDTIYARHKDVRDVVTRGCVLVSRGKQHWLFQGFPKFIGMTSNDDDDVGKLSEEEQKELSSDVFFDKPVERAAVCVRTMKENGKAAHFGVFYDEERKQRMFIFGSKNSHGVLAAPLQPDEAKEDDAENCGWFRDWWDKRVEELDAGQQQSLKAAAAQAILKQLDGMTSANRNEFIEALERTQFFANYELMLVEDQHVVDYALTEPRAAFLALTGRRVHNEAYLKKFGKAFDPGNALVWAQKLGVAVAKFEIREYSAINIKTIVEEIRTTERREGEVLYFVDKASRCIGMWKTKTAWYVLLRAIREKVIGQLGKDTSSFVQRVNNRIDQIKVWLPLSEKEVQFWKKAALHLRIWLHAKMKIDGNSVDEVKSKKIRVREHYAKLVAECFGDEFGVNSELGDPPNEELHVPKALEGDSIGEASGKSAMSKSKKRRARKGRRKANRNQVDLH